MKLSGSETGEADAVACPSMLSMSHDRYIDPLRKAVERVHAHGTRMFIQLYHPGRQNVAIFPAVWQFNEHMEKYMEGRSEDIKRCICCLSCMEVYQENIMNGRPVEGADIQYNINADRGKEALRQGNCRGRFRYDRA